MGTKQAVAKAQRMAVIGLVALLLAGGGLVGGPTGAGVALAGNQPIRNGSEDAQGQERDRPGEEIPSEREEGPSAQGAQGGINSGGEF